MGVINDFQDSVGFLDYKVYGSLEVFDASYVKGGEPDHTGDIGVFLNFKLLGRFKTKQQALAFIKQLIREAPPGAQEFFAAHQSVLLENLC